MRTLFLIFVVVLLACASSHSSDDSVRRVEGSIKITKRYTSDSVSSGKARIKCYVYNKLQEVPVELMNLRISGEALKGVMTYNYLDGPEFEIDIPSGNFSIEVWYINKEDSEKLQNVISNSNEVIEINVELGGASIE